MRDRRIPPFGPRIIEIAMERMRIAGDFRKRGESLSLKVWDADLKTSPGADPLLRPEFYSLPPRAAWHLTQ